MATIIYTDLELQDMESDLTADYELGSDIDCSDTATWNAGAGFVPIGQGAPYFTGSLDGKGYTIKNLTVNRNGTDYCGLIGCTDGATLQNINLIDISITGENSTGGLVGLIFGVTTISNCSSTGAVNGHNYTGGIFGLSTGADIVEDCWSSATVISDGGYVGGFLGLSSGSADIARCYATGAVTGTDRYAGGFAGYTSGAGTVDRCCCTGAVIVGNVGGDSYSGGFVGYNGLPITDCYSRSSITGTGNYVGGFVGVSGTETRCYATGAITGVGANIGGFCGSEDTIVNCFWDKETTGYATDEAVTGTTGLTTAEAKDIRTYQTAEWPISTIWNITSGCNDGYPCLLDVNPCCAVASPGDNTIIGDKVTLEAIRNIEIVYGGRFLIDKSGKAVYESRYHRNV